MRWWWVHPRPVCCRLEKVGTFQDWFDIYRLASQGLAMKEEIGDSQAVPVRAFVTLDPGGYFLEFDRFLDDGRNQRIIFFLNMEG